MPIKKSDLYSSLWASCDQLRSAGGMNTSLYKDYVLFMLFIKYISDKYGNSDDFAPPVTIPPGSSFKDMIALKGKTDIGDKINIEVIQPLVDKNARLARTDFPDFNDPNKLGEGQAMVDTITNLIGIFENPALNFSKNRAENDDILGDAYEYLMRHFATESGKSKGQFYTPSEVSRIMAKVIGITPSNTVAATTAYDPTCGSGSLLLKVAAQAGKHITLEGQEKDVTTAGLARMNMILHDFPTANILSGNTLASQKFKDGNQLRTYDYVVANPPFSEKAWSSGLTPAKDEYQRFTWGEPPAKQGDYAFLLHIIRSMKSTGKAACILLHGVLFRGNAESVIRQQLVRSGYLKGIIGLPANLFYGTGIPACILVLDKENAQARKGIFMIDASKGFIKDGNKNRLREQDIHRIVDAFEKQIEEVRYSRMVGFLEIADPKNDYNLNLPRYIDSSEPEDIQDIDAHLRGGIPSRDLAALERYWKVIPAVRETIFSPNRTGYFDLKKPIDQVKTAIFGHAEFTAFIDKVHTIFNHWKATNTTLLKAFGSENVTPPKQLIENLSENLLETFRAAPLLDAYDIYQHLMDFWAATMQDDCYLITDDGWKTAAQPRLMLEDKNNKLKVKPDLVHGKKKYLTELIPPALLIKRYFALEQAKLEELEVQIAGFEQQIEELTEEHTSEEGLLIEALNEKDKLTKISASARLKKVQYDPEAIKERNILEKYLGLLHSAASVNTELKIAQDKLTQKLIIKYPELTEIEIKTLVVEDKWLATLSEAVQSELNRVSQTLTSRIKELAERYAAPLPEVSSRVAALEEKVNQHLTKMGFTWN